MRIGITAGGPTADRIVERAVQAERDGFTSLWYPSGVAGGCDPLLPMALAGRATSTIELGTAVLQTLTSHPLHLASRTVGAVNAMGRPGLTIGIGPSHASLMEDIHGIAYDRPGQYTEEFARILVGTLAGGTKFDGGLLRAHASKGPGRQGRPDHPVPVLLGALAPRMLRVAGEVADGTITWMANVRAIEQHVAPRIHAAAAGRPSPRIVVGLPVAVHDDVAEARAAAAEQFAIYAGLPNYQRILAVGGIAGPADAAVIGDERAVEAELQRLVDAGATDIWAAPFGVGKHPESRARVLALLASLSTP